MHSYWTWPVLFCTGLLAGFVDSIAGGGGLITLPVLLNLGMPPQEALATNKLQATFGSGSAAFHYGQANLFEWRACLVGIICTAIGALLGSLAVLHVSPSFLRALIPWLLTAIAVYFLLRPQLGLTLGRAVVHPGLFHLSAGILLGFYDGFFGPGTGSFWAMSYILMLGFDLVRATAYTKVMNFTSNIISLAVFASLGHVAVTEGLVMGLGQLTGARLGSRTVIKKGTRFIRPVFITVTLAITLKLLYSNLTQQ